MKEIPYFIPSKKSLKEIQRLSVLLQETTNEEEKKAIQAQAKICEALSWKDYKSMSQENTGEI